MDFIEVKSISQCIELATVDAYGDDEIAMGWETCMDEIFNGIHAILGEQTVKIENFEALGGIVLVRCRIKRRKVSVTMESLDFVVLSAPQKLWLKAFLKWQGQAWGR